MGLFEPPTGNCGTIVSKPIRVAYLNGDYDKAIRLIRKQGLGVVYTAVASVEPYHATIHLAPADYDKAVELLNRAKIRWFPPTPFF